MRRQTALPATAMLTLAGSGCVTNDRLFDDSVDTAEVDAPFGSVVPMPGEAEASASAGAPSMAAIARGSEPSNPQVYG